MKTTKFPTSLHYFFSTQSPTNISDPFWQHQKYLPLQFVGIVAEFIHFVPSPLTSIRDISGWPTFRCEFSRHQTKHAEEKTAVCWILRFTLLLVIDCYLECDHFFYLSCGCTGTWCMNHGWKNLTVYKLYIYVHEA